MSPAYLALVLWAVFVAAFLLGWISHAAVWREQRRTVEIDFTRRRVGE